jgi:alpha-glucosidase
VHSCDHPDIHDVVAELRRVLEEYPGDRLLIGEIYLPLERLMAYYGADLDGTHLPFNFQLISAPWDAVELRRLIQEYEAALPAGGWPNWVLGNHDRPRIATRVGPAQARVAAMLLLTLRGTPTLYYGDELGMENVPIPPERERDPFGMNQPGTGTGRDPERTPMQWSTEPFAGFSTVEPWLPLADDWEIRNVQVQQGEARSMLNLVRALLSLRRSTPCLATGSYRTLTVEGDVLLYAREQDGATRLVALNLDAAPKVVMFGEPVAGARVLLSTELDRQGEEVAGELALRADEGVIIEVNTA